MGHKLNGNADRETLATEQQNLFQKTGKVLKDQQV